jgi:hypothetical protein
MGELIVWFPRIVLLLFVVAVFMSKPVLLLIPLAGVGVLVAAEYFRRNGH